MMSSCDPVTKILGKRKWVVVMCTTSRSSPLLKGKNVSYLFIIFARWDKDVMVIAGRLSWTMRLINKLIIVKQPYQLSRWLPPPCHSSKKFKDLKKKPPFYFVWVIIILGLFLIIFVPVCNCLNHYLWNCSNLWNISAKGGKKNTHKILQCNSVKWGELV